MAGDETLEALRTYVSRLLGRPLASDEPVTLRSVEKAALASWARKTGVALSAESLRRRGPLRLAEMTKGPGEIAPEVPADQRPAVRSASGAIAGVGIDIEDVDSLPRPADYRSDPFFCEHFTAGEIARCLQDGDVSAAFCGLWAAKEAIVKSGAAGHAPDRLAAIEIEHDAAGRPQYPGCHVSISRTRHAAVAVCLWIAM